jgi:hypothetical protein
MPNFKSWKSLDKYLKKSIKSAFYEDTAKKVKDEMFQNILNEVYAKYNPRVYERRYDNDGLMDRNNIVMKPKRNNGMEIYNIAKRKDYNTNLYLAPLIEYGQRKAKSNNIVGYRYPYPHLSYYKARPFVGKTREDLKKYKSHIKAFRFALRKLGIYTKVN